MVYLLICKNQFPKPIEVEPRAVGFIEDKIDQWVLEK
ncbi:AlpA family phage regulatory protein [Pectobacterium atrosepticum]|jgi:predicted DNA-binding transcriptional regulator AlpA